MKHILIRSLITCLLHVSVSGAWEQSDSQKVGPYDETHVLVGVTPSSTRSQRDAAVGAIGSVARSYRTLPGVVLVKLHAGQSVRNAIVRLHRQSGVRYVEPDYYYSIKAVPNDTRFSEQYALNNGSADADIDAVEGWDIRSDASGAIVAVLDTGVRFTHSDLAANMWRNAGEIPGNGVDDDANGYVDDIYGINAINGSGNPNDDNGHGTHCAGNIGAVGNNGVGVAGVAWKAKIMALKFMDSGGSGKLSDSIECIDYAIAHGATIISGSFGRSGGSSSSEREALERARQAGILFAFAAGNSGTDNDTRPHYPSSYTLDNIIAVAATGSDDRLASFSCYGRQSVDLGAPGVRILSVSRSSDTSYTSLTGTSMAAPVVAGVLALVRAHFPNETPSAIRQRVLTGVDPVATLAGRSVTGGRANLAKALAGGSTQPPVPIPPPAPPINDQFADATVANEAIMRGDNRFATKQSGEPSHAGNAGGKSVWWRWTAPFSGPATVSTAGSDFDTLLAVYQGNTVSSLSPIAANDNSGGTRTSAVTFQAEAGAVFHIAVDGANSSANPTNAAQGQIVLTLPALPNDAFAGALTLSEKGAADNRWATKESGEPDHAGNPGGKSLWWNWTASGNGRATITTAGSSFDTTLAIYTGDQIASLQLVAANDDEAHPQTRTSRVQFMAVSGTVYRVAVDGFRNSSGTAAGSIQLEVSWEAAAGTTASGSTSGSSGSVTAQGTSGGSTGGASTGSQSGGSSGGVGGATTGSTAATSGGATTAGSSGAGGSSGATTGADPTRWSVRVTRPRAGRRVVVNPFVSMVRGYVENTGLPFRSTNFLVEAAVVAQGQTGTVEGPIDLVWKAARFKTKVGRRGNAKFAIPAVSPTGNIVPGSRAEIWVRAADERGFQTSLMATTVVEVIVRR